MPEEVQRTELHDVPVNEIHSEQVCLFPNDSIPYKAVAVTTIRKQIMKAEIPGSVV